MPPMPPAPTGMPCSAAEVVAEIHGEGAEVTPESLTAVAMTLVARLRAAHRAYHADAIRAGLIVKALRDTDPPLSWREIDRLTGIAQRTAGRWLKLAEDDLVDPDRDADPDHGWTPS